MKRIFFLTLIVFATCITGLFIFNKKSENPTEIIENKDLKKIKSNVPKYDQPGLMAAFEFERQKNRISNQIPSLAKLNAYNKVKKMLSFQKDAVNNINWNERGPDNVGGRTRALMFDPNDVTNSKVWAGAVGGGIWFNNNITSAASEWQSVDDFMGSLAVTALAYDPSNTNTFYAGTGEGFFNVDAIRGLGIWKSTDAGTTWNQLASTIPSDGPTAVNRGFYNITDLVVTQTGTILATTRGRFSNTGGLMRSTDGGNTWTNIVPAGASTHAADIEIAANGDIYVSFGLIFSNGSIYRSTDDGVTWTNVTPPNDGIGNAQRIEMAIAPSMSAATGTTVIYAAAQSSTTRQLAYLKKSTDGGANWTDITIPAYINQSCVATTDDFTNGQAWYDLIIQIKPDDPNTLLIGGVDLFRSTDGGASWSRASDWADRPCSAEDFVHADQHQIIFRPGSNTEAIFGNDGGIFHTTDITSGIIDFNSRNNGYNVTQFYTNAQRNITNDNTFLAGAQDNGTQVFNDPGINSTFDLTSGDGAFCFFDQDDNRIVAHTQNGNVQFFDASGSFLGNSNFNSGRFINPTTYDSDNNIVYAADASNTLRRTNFNGASNTATVGLNGGQISAITLSPFTANRLFVATQNGDVFRIDNTNTGGPSVTEITGSLPNSYINCIAIGENDNELLVTFTSYGVDHVYLTTNGGTTWVSKDDNLPDMPVYWALFNPSNSDEILIATEYGVWSTDRLSNASPNWEITSTGLANVRCDMLTFRAIDNNVAVATHGRGLYTATAFIAADWISSTDDGNWNNAANWTLGREPVATDDITLDHGFVSPGYTVTVTADAGVGNLTFDNSDINLVIEAGVTFTYSTITGNGNIILEDGASLVPNAGQSGAVSGNFTVTRNKPSGQDIGYYNFWSSPVTTGNSSMLTGAQDLFSLAKGAGSASTYYTTFSGAMENGRGYAATNVATATFTGTVNNGTINYGIEDNTGTGDGVFNLIGNPYPSAIDADEFINDNGAAVIDGALYLWSQQDANDRTDTENSEANFIAVNYSGGSSYSQTDNLANINIASGQGFGVAAAANGNITFENDQRNGLNSDFKSDKTLRSAEYAWFSIAQEGVDQSILIAFGEQATNGSDFLYDAHSFASETNLQIAAMIKNELFLIDAMPLSDAVNTIPLSVTVPKAGTYSITLNKTENLSPSRSAILRDKLEGKEYAMEKGTSIDFTATEAFFSQDRFEIVFTNAAVGINDKTKNAKVIVWTSTSTGIKLHSLNAFTSQISIYNNQGQLISTESLDGNSSKNVNLATGVYILNIENEKGKNTIRAVVQ